MNVDAVARAVGLVVIVVAVACVDWRAGLAAFGLALILSTIDYRRAA